jgi:hypothetical protein
MQTGLREAARRVCKPKEILGAVGLINHLGKACFVQGLHNELVQTIVRSRGESILLSQAVEISLEEEGAVLSIREKSGASGNNIRCTNSNRLGHTASRCMSKGRLPPVNARAVSFISCFNCGRAGHLARHCRQRLNRETCGLRGHEKDICQGTTLDTWEARGLTEAACKIRTRNWTSRETNIRGRCATSRAPRRRNSSLSHM